MAGRAVALRRWTGSNPDPTSFTLNGTTCTGGIATGSRPGNGGNVGAIC